MNGDGNAAENIVIDLDVDQGEVGGDGANEHGQEGDSGVAAADLTPVDDPGALRDEVEEEYEGIYFTLTRKIVTLISIGRNIRR